MCSFEHNFAVVYLTWCVSTKLYQLRHAMTCTFSLKSMSLHHLYLRGRILVQRLTYCFYCFDQYEIQWDVFTVKDKLDANVWLTKTCPCANFHIGGRVRLCSFTFWLTETCLYAYFDTQRHDCAQFRTYFPLVHLMRRVSKNGFNCETWTTCKFSLKRRVST